MTITRCSGTANEKKKWIKQSAWKPNDFQGTEKNTTRQTKKYPKIASKRGFAVIIFLSAVSIGEIQKTSLKTFMRKGLTALNKWNTTKMSCKKLWSFFWVSDCPSNTKKIWKKCEKIELFSRKDTYTYIYIYIYIYIYMYI